MAESPALKSDRVAPSVEWIGLVASRFLINMMGIAIA
jgi:hypothetical protein